ncbi:hypothetical protein LDENG_00128840 [Lucifuga dentata]|nr:hypothetical protein LDENG_00128840 [Lucifuga dentata]
MDEHGSFPIMNITWKIQANAGVFNLNGSEIHILDEYTNQSMCVHYSYKINQQLNPEYTKSLICQNLTTEITGLENKLPSQLGISQLSQCEILFTIQPFFIRCKNDCLPQKKLLNYCLYYAKPSPRTLIIKATVGLVMIGGCITYLLWRGSHKDSVNKSSAGLKEEPDGIQAQRKRVLIIYSLDHPLYKNIILKLCAFLIAKCSTEVVLDLLDSARLGVLGRVKWLEWHIEQIENSSDKILILCSRGVQAKWRAMCGDKQVFLREDALSTVGDMLTPAFCLIIPNFVRSLSFQKYIVAYFDDVCSEEDVPLPFNITVRYKLMEQFEELFFRILDIEKLEPGRLNHIEGLANDEYYHCPSGRALRDSIEAFHAYQLEHPQWFEDELLKCSELEVEEISYNNTQATANLITCCVTDCAHVVSHMGTQQSDVTVNSNTVHLNEHLHLD